MLSLALDGGDDAVVIIVIVIVVVKTMHIVNNRFQFPPSLSRWPLPPFATEFPRRSWQFGSCE